MKKMTIGTIAAVVLIFAACATVDNPPSEDNREVQADNAPSEAPQPEGIVANLPAAPVTHTVAAGDDIASIAMMYFGNAYEATLDHIVRDNPVITSPNNLHLGWVLAINPMPADVGGLAVSVAPAEDAPPEAEPSESVAIIIPTLPTTHTVVDGDHLANIAMRYFGNNLTATIDHIIRDNPIITSRHHLHLGWVLAINPMPADVGGLAAPVAPAEDAPPEAEPSESVAIIIPTLPTTHTVVDGDHLANIAMRYFGNNLTATIDHIVRDNPVITSPNNLHLGWVLAINPMPADVGGLAVSVAPAEDAAQPESPAAGLPGLSTTHTVAAGDSLPSIAMMYFGNAYTATIEHILRDNPRITSPNNLHLGWVLVINPMPAE